MLLMIFYFDIWNTKSLFFCCHDGCDMGCQVFTKGIQIFWPKIIIIKGILTHFYGFRRNVLACSGVWVNEVFLLYLFKALFIAWTYPLAPSSYHVVQNKNIKHSTEGWSRTQNKSSSIKRNAHLDHKVNEIEFSNISFMFLNPNNFFQFEF